LRVKPLARDATVLDMYAEAYVSNIATAAGVESSSVATKQDSKDCQILAQIFTLVAIEEQAPGTNRQLSWFRNWGGG